MNPREMITKYTKRIKNLLVPNMTDPSFGYGKMYSRYTRARYPKDIGE